MAELFIVATPIGNLEDLSLRARRILSEVEIICAEDTRVARKLLDLVGIFPVSRMISVHAHNESSLCLEVTNHLNNGLDIAYISDAGTPCISDPGFRLVASVSERGFRVTPIPGVSAITAALSICHFDCSSFLFLGFVGSKSQQRRRVFQKNLLRTESLVFFEAPHRIDSFLEDALMILGSREAMVARELSKKFENIYRGNLSKLSDFFSSEGSHRRGEFVVIVKGIEPLNSLSENYFVNLNQSLILLSSMMSTKQASEIGSKIFSLPKREIYERIISISKKPKSN